MLISALRMLNTVKCFCNLVIVVNDSDGVNLKEKINEAKLNNQIWFYGACYSEELLGEDL